MELAGSLLLIFYCRLLLLHAFRNFYQFFHSKVCAAQCEAQAIFLGALNPDDIRVGGQLADYGPCGGAFRHGEDIHVFVHGGEVGVKALPGVFPEQNPQAAAGGQHSGGILPHSLVRPDKGIVGRVGNGVAQVIGRGNHIGDFRYVSFRASSASSRLGRMALAREKQ